MLKCELELAAACSPGGMNPTENLALVTRHGCETRAAIPGRKARGARVFVGRGKCKKTGWSRIPAEDTIPSEGGSHLVLSPGEGQQVRVAERGAYERGQVQPPGIVRRLIVIIAIPGT